MEKQLEFQLAKPLGDRVLVSIESKESSMTKLLHSKETICAIPVVTAITVQKNTMFSV